MWNEVWGSHIVTADAQTQKHNYWGCVSLQRVSYSAAYVCVCVFAPRVSRSLEMVCDMRRARGHNTESYWLLLILHSLVSFFFFFRHVTRHFLPPEGCARLPVIVALRFLRHRSESGRMMWRRKREEGGRGRAVDFLWVWVWKHYLLFRGCCSEAAGWRALPAVPNRNWERDALIKKTPMKALSTHKHTHSLLPRLLWKPSLSLHLIHTPGWKHIILEVHRKRNCYITIINMCGCVLDLTYHEPCLGEGIHCKYKSKVQSSTVKGSTASHEHMMWL